MIDSKTYRNDSLNILSTLLQEQKISKRKNEKALQDYFEKYPSALLGSLDGVEAQYNVYGSIIISQPRLKSYDSDRQPDFLIVTSNSLNLYFNFIELEDPSKKIFGLNQNMSADFNQAYNQLIQWRSFKTEIHNYCDHLLRTVFHENFDSSVKKVIHYNYILVYGFSDEITSLGSRYNGILQNYFVDTNLHHCTYSRILSNFRIDYPLFCIKKEGMDFNAIGFVPFKRYSTSEWSDLHNVKGKAQLIRDSGYFNENEKQALISEIEEMDAKTLKEVMDQIELRTISFTDLDIW